MRATITLDENIVAELQAEVRRSGRSFKIDCLESSEVTGLSFGTVLAFVRITTSARIFQPPSSTKEAYDIVDEWLRMPSVSLLGPTERHWSIFEKLAIESQDRGPLVSGADLDRDFTHIQNLRIEFPLVQK